MAASSDSDLYNSEQWSSTRGLSPSWEDDETTMAYSSQHLQTLQRHGGSSPPPLAADAGSGEWDDASSGYDPAPIVLEIFDARASTTLPRPRAQPTSRKTQAGMPTAAAAHARQLRRSGPQPSAAATQPRLRARTRAAVQSAPPAARHHDPRRTGPQPPQRTAAAIERRPLATLANSTRVELEDEPFARPSAWRGPLARSVAGAIGLVGAVLSGMVLLDASAGEPATVSAEQLSVPAAAVALLPSTPTPAQPARDAPQETPSVPAATIAPIEARGHVAPSHAASHSHSFTRTATAAHPPRKPVAHEINEPTDTGARETPKP
ncbi:MAG TPA: hypothetical protein VGI70_14820, partial [Polyangiales bacterium]